MSFKPICDIGDPAPGWAPKAIDTITSLVRTKSCTHVDIKELLPRELTLYGFFDACCQKCLDATCEKKFKNSRLCVFINRIHSSFSDALLRILIDVEITPSNYLKFPTGKDKEGSSWHRLEVVVVHPIYEKSLQRYAERVVRVDIVPLTEPLDAGVSVHAKTRTGQRSAQLVSVDIPVKLIPVKPKEQLVNVADVLEVGLMDLTAVVLTTSLKILMEDGWRWLKSKVAENTQLISLQIGDIEIKPDNTQMLAESVKSFASRVSTSARDELNGYNTQLDALARQKRYLLEEVERTSTAIDKARTKAEIHNVDVDMDRVREKIYAQLQILVDLRLNTDNPQSRSTAR